MASTPLLEALERFAAREPGPQSFEELAEDCRRLAQDAAGAQACHALIGLAARQFADGFEGQALSVEEAAAARRRLGEAGIAAARALVGGAEEQLRALNGLAAELLL